MDQHTLYRGQSCIIKNRFQNIEYVPKIERQHNLNEILQSMTMRFITDSIPETLQLQLRRSFFQLSTKNT